MKEKIIKLLEAAIKSALDRGQLEQVSLPFIEVEPARDPAHGDYASNVALIIASQLKKNPRQIAEILVHQIEDENQTIEKVEIAGPGFMNFFIRPECWLTELFLVNSLRNAYGTSLSGQGRKVQVEFVSANPTGPLHIGHARGAIVGDAIANILERSGYLVHREYYINDAGNQMNNLGKSLYLRYLELLGEKVDFPDTCYQGGYVKDLAREILARDGNIHQTGDREEVIPFFTEYAGNAILAGIKDDLRDFGVVFDRYFSERELYMNDTVSRVLKELQEEGHVYSEGETLWFRSTAFGDEKDRVVVRRTGEPTYFAADLAYHKDKFNRGYDLVIDIWGADHHGYIPRMMAGVQSLGREKKVLRIVLVQLVNLLREGTPVAMSTRSGEFVTMREVLQEVGKDAARYNFLMRRSDSHLDFDLELAKRQSNENPVYYVQYAHARICSIIRMAEEKGYQMDLDDEARVNRLNLAEEMALIKAAVRYQEILEGAAMTLEPHRLTFYLNDLAALFHSYYNKHRIISDDEELMRARLFLVRNIRIVLYNALHILGVSAPERME